MKCNVCGEELERQDGFPNVFQHHSMKQCVSYLQSQLTAANERAEKAERERTEWAESCDRMANKLSQAQLTAANDRADKAERERDEAMMWAQTYHETMTESNALAEGYYNCMIEAEAQLVEAEEKAQADAAASAVVEQELRKAAEKVAGSKLITISHGVELLCVFPEDMAALRAALSLPASECKWPDKKQTAHAQDKEE